MKEIPAGGSVTTASNQPSGKDGNTAIASPWYSARSSVSCSQNGVGIQFSETSPGGGGWGARATSIAAATFSSRA
jgi:hypothetical protein